jgi:hypothetical protein
MPNEESGLAVAQVSLEEPRPARKSHKKNKEADPRFQPLTAFYCEEARKRNGIYQWDGSDAKQLQALLKANPSIDVDVFKRYLTEAFDWAESPEWSPLLPGFRFRQFASLFSTIAARLENAIGPRVNHNAVMRVFERYRAQAGCVDAAKRTAWWERVFRSRLGIAYEDAVRIYRGASE